MFCFSENFYKSTCTKFLSSGRSDEKCINCLDNKVCHVIKVKNNNSDCILHFFCAIRNSRALYSKLDLQQCLQLIGPFLKDILTYSHLILKNFQRDELCNKLIESITTFKRKIQEFGLLSPANIVR